MTSCTEERTASKFVEPTWQSGDVKLVNSSSSEPTEGYVLLYMDLRNGTADWGTVCDQVISSASDDVICRQLGYFGAEQTAAKAKRR